jgi:hypothetical protein
MAQRNVIGDLREEFQDGLNELRTEVRRYGPDTPVRYSRNDTGAPPDFAQNTLEWVFARQRF